MSIYKFSCEKCKKEFTLTMKISEYEKDNFKCPACNCTDVKRLITPFQTQTSKKS